MVRSLGSQMLLIKEIMYKNYIYYWNHISKKVLVHFYRKYLIWWIISFWVCMIQEEKGISFILSLWKFGDKSFYCWGIKVRWRLPPTPIFTFHILAKFRCKWARYCDFIMYDFFFQDGYWFIWWSLLWVSMASHWRNEGFAVQSDW